MNILPHEDIPTWIPVCAAFWLLGSVWRGWNRGLVRQAVALVSLILAVAVAFYLGPILAPALPAIGFPRFLRPLVAGILVALLIWFLVTAFSAILFKRTEEQSIGLIRTFYGLGGAFLGLLSGLFLLGVGAWGVRVAGTLADGLQQGALVKPTKKGEPTTAAPDPSPLASLKRELEGLPLQGWISHLDPVPEDWYPRLRKIGEILTSQPARDRLLADPGFQSVARNPRLVALREDPSIQEALRSADLWTLLRDPKVQAAAADTQLLTALRMSDFDLALDRALRPPNRPTEQRPPEIRRAKP